MDSPGNVNAAVNAAAKVVFGPVSWRSHRKTTVLIAGALVALSAAALLWSTLRWRPRPPATEAAPRA